MKSLSHAQAQTLIRAALDDELNLYDRVALEAHLATCAACQAEAARWQALVETLHAHQPNRPALPPGPRLVDLEHRTAHVRSWARWVSLALGGVLALLMLWWLSQWVGQTASQTVAALLPSATPTLTATPHVIPAPSVTPTPRIAYGVTDGARLVHVRGGLMERGSTVQDVVSVRSACEQCAPADYSNETPASQVVVPEFWLDETEVTVRQYNYCVSAGRCPPLDVPQAANPAYGGYPVTNLTWEAANLYCQWAQRRLPTEAEWERAARGPDNFLYPWGDITPSVHVQFQLGRLAPVGGVLSDTSSFGVRGLAGNVAEWVSDRYAPRYDEPYAESLRVVRGGSWQAPLSAARAAHRDFAAPGTASPAIGFRCALDAVNEGRLMARSPFDFNAVPLGRGAGRVAFQSFNPYWSSGQTLWINADGTGLEPLPISANLGGRTMAFSRWSPNGALLPVWVERPSVGLQAGVYDVRAGFLTPLSLVGSNPVDPGMLVDAAWSPDSRQVIFTGVRGPNTNLYLFSAETGQGRPFIPLTEDAKAFSARWSPDGRAVAFYVQNAQTASPALYITTAHGQFVLSVDDPLLAVPNTSGDLVGANGTIPAFFAWVSAGELVYLRATAAERQLELVRLRAGQTTQPEVVSTFEGIPQLLFDFTLSPNRREALVTLINNEDSTLWHFDLTTGTGRIVPVVGLSDVFAPAWSPDGQWLMAMGHKELTLDPASSYLSEIPRVYDLFLFPAAALTQGEPVQPVQVTNLGGLALFPGWQP